MQRRGLRLPAPPHLPSEKRKQQYISELYLPHQGIVIVSLDLADVDNFALERAEANADRDGLGAEDSQLRTVLEDGLQHR